MASDESYAPDKDASYSLSSEADDEAGDRPKQRKRPAPGRGGRGGGNAGRTAVPGRGQRGRGGGREQAAPGPGARGQRGGSRGQRGGRGGGQEVAPSPAGRGQTAGRGGESAGPSERRSGRGSRGRRGGRDEAEEERVQRLQTERRVQTEALIQQMGEGELRELTTQLFSREPGLVFDALLTLGNTPTPPPAAALPWCTCGNCREMTTDLERKCCGQGPNHCISQLPHFNLYCLEDGYLRLHRQYRNDVWVVGDAREPGDDNREFRYAAYRQYIFWQHGALGQGNRRVIPSCCVWRIRDKYPDPLGQYTGFVPTI